MRNAPRARMLAHAIRHLELRAGDAVATLAGNNHRHLEAYYAVSGRGLVIHTCNPRLHPDQLIYIINHAEDRVLFFDRTFAPLIERVAPRCPKVKAWIGFSDAANMPALAGVDNVLCYEDCIAPHPGEFDWPCFDERSAAAICYTSGTTGNPKGALYSHRAIVLNATACCLPGVLSISPRDTVLPAVPMFHVNGWCIPYAAPIGGAKLVLPGQRLDGASLYELMEAQGVTISAGVPTIWLALMSHLEQGGLRFSTLERIGVGGSAMPMALIAKFADVYGVEVRHGWGMTEDRGGRDHELFERSTDEYARRRTPRPQRQTRQVRFWHRDQSHRSERRHSAPRWRLARRIDGARPMDHRALLQIRCLGARRWVVPDRRHCHHRSTGHRADQRPGQGPDQDRR
jgi:acyl-CoA synthetase (AMP-forming)/AMP-acid ligase II